MMLKHMIRSNFKRRNSRDSSPRRESRFVVRELAAPRDTLREISLDTLKADDLANV